MVTNDSSADDASTGAGSVSGVNSTNVI